MWMVYQRRAAGSGVPSPAAGDTHTRSTALVAVVEACTEEQAAKARIATTRANILESWGRRGAGEPPIRWLAERIWTNAMECLTLVNAAGWVVTR